MKRDFYLSLIFAFEIASIKDPNTPKQILPIVLTEYLRVMKRQGHVFCKGHLAGELAEREDGMFIFSYHSDYLALSSPLPVSLTLPLQKEPHVAKKLFPFFYGLLAEGALKELQCRKLKIDEKDVFGRLLKTTGGDTIGDVIVKEAK